MKLKKNGFTLVEIVVVVAILAVIAGIFAVNMVKTLNKNAKADSDEVVNEIKSAADAYIAVNTDAIENLYNGYGYVDISVGELKNSGYLTEDIKNPETGVVYSDDEKVRIEIATGNEVNIIFPLTDEQKAQKYTTLKADKLFVTYDKNNKNWCDSENVYSGLYDGSNFKYSDVTSKLVLVDNSKDGAYYALNEGETYRGEPIKLQSISCNVNAAIAGDYQIEYSYKDPYTTTTKTTVRDVSVVISNDDIISYTAKINKGNLIPLNSTKATITITNYLRNGSIATLTDILISELNSKGYSISNYSTNSVGKREATIKYNKANSDGSLPQSVKASYTVTDNLADVKQTGNDCEKVSNSSKCYYPGNNTNNYVKYYNYTFRIYSIENTYTNLITDAVYGSKIPYPQMGACISSCCNQGRISYIALGDTNNSRFSNSNMDSVLNNFYNTINNSREPKYISSLNFNSFSNVEDYSTRTYDSYNNSIIYYNSVVNNRGVYKTSIFKKIALLSVEDYKHIANCTSETNCLIPNNYVGTNMWLLDFYSAQFGVGAYNQGAKPAEIKDFAVNSSGTIYHAGVTKSENSNTIITDSLYIKPVIQLGNAKISSGSGTKEDPYIININ